MKKLTIIIILAGFLVTSAFAKGIDVAKSKGTGQSVIVSLTPKPASMDADQNVTLEAAFNVPLDEKSVQKNSVKLKRITKNKKQKIKGNVVYDAAKNAVMFTPDALLNYGYYEVEFKGLKAAKADKKQHIKEIKYRFYVPEVINGYKLPPEPDEALNNATLLGIDVNDNGVRDDVERKIIAKYQKPIEIELMMTYAKIDQETLEKPLSEALVLERKASRASDCEMYLLDFGIDIKDSIGDSEDFTYNTKIRAKKYINYNEALSGGVYGGSPADETVKACDFDVEQMLKDRK